MLSNTQKKTKITILTMKKFSCYQAFAEYLQKEIQDKTQMHRFGNDSFIKIRNILK